jgi:hypothetical protein
MRTAIALVLVAASARAHTPAPEEVVASLAAPAARAATGVERVERARANPRVLLIHVGAAWPAIPRAARATAAAEWRERWRHAVPQGVVAVLDRHGRPAVRYGRSGAVVGLREDH